MRRDFIYILSLVALLSIVACDNNGNMSTENKSVSTATSKNTSASPTPTNATTTMNLKEIQDGNYSSLQGTWTEVAYVYNPQNGTGVQWSADISTSCATLKVTSDKIDFNDSMAVIQGNALIDFEGSHPLLFNNSGCSLDASIKDYLDTQYCWDVTFYPKGVDANKDMLPNNGVKIDNSKNIIVVFLTGDDIAVFAQTDTNS